LSEQYFTSSQTFAQALRQAKGRPQQAQIFVGRSAFFFILPTGGAPFCVTATRGNR
jgi:hypothetical protein